ncbi:hypothetical protein EQG49_06770 [Periweissella cryptocerci]|uniref:Uncharacterized protein n=1 Tax=Periweissella cryptocerci TaxID=2506420 RepID=A0A4P6YTU2_9LACO|nr:hypothetical protein [Periweissella cryptocerci]QBO36184.1 hypothetical protein EQG49_06770 [Periweissella cryptocerci]
MKKFNYTLWLVLILLTAAFGVLYSKMYHYEVVLLMSLFCGVWGNGYLLVNFIGRMRYILRTEK